jgi:hypothetical protein
VNPIPTAASRYASKLISCRRCFQRAERIGVRDDAAEPRAGAEDNRFVLCRRIGRVKLPDLQRYPITETGILRIPKKPENGFGALAEVDPTFTTKTLTAYTTGAIFSAYCSSACERQDWRAGFADMRPR